MADQGGEDRSPSGRVRNRKQQFKSTADPDEARRNRIDDDAQIRKAEKAMLLAQKRSRNMGTGADGSAVTNTDANSSVFNPGPRDSNGNILGGGMENGGKPNVEYSMMRIF